MTATVAAAAYIAQISLALLFLYWLMIAILGAGRPGCAFCDRMLPELGEAAYCIDGKRACTRCFAERTGNV